jgi:hypothetical protein
VSDEAKPQGARGSATRGVVAAMAMTGMRRVTTGLGLVREAPPEAIARQGFPALLARVPIENREEAIELAHWAYGAVGGAIFGSLPTVLRRQVWAGPAYGLAVWMAFEGLLAPLLGIESARDRKVVERLAVAADHLLYGAIVADRPRAQ